MKFGGTSLGSAQAIGNALEIVRRSLDRRPVLVVSAHAGITNALLELGRRSSDGAIDCSGIVNRHSALLADLGLDPELLDDLHRELADLARGMSLVGEASPRALDYLLSFGERCSSRTIAAYFCSEGVSATAVNSAEAGLRTDSNFGRARPLPDDGRIAAALATVTGVPIITGFIGGDERGNLTTLGRNGSDFSATLFGRALHADEIQIWTDVDGVMTADPSLVPGARRIATMSFDEASELAYYGGRVLHPATLVPAMDGRIPVRVLNTHDAHSAGTLILPDHQDPEVIVRSIVYREGIHLVNLVTPRMLQAPGYLARVFGIAARHAVDVDLVATSEVSVTMTTEDPRPLPEFIDELQTLGEVSTEAAQALVCVVGQGIFREPGVAARVLSTLAQRGVRVRVISQGAIRVNLALVVAERDLAVAVTALHAEFFPG